MVSVYLFGCGDARTDKTTADATVKEPLVQLPFIRGTSHACVEGEESDVVHTLRENKYDIDFASTAGADVVAPVSGTAYTHGGTRFGKHVNIDIGNGEYVVVGFMGKIVVADGAQVAAGQIIGASGSVHGRENGVHIGLHSGDSDEAAAQGESLPIARLLTRDIGTVDGFGEVSGASLVCANASIVGHRYESASSTVFRHVPGTLIKTAASPKVYRVNADMSASWIVDEEVFSGSGFADAMIVPISDAELTCYARGPDIETPLERTTSGMADGSLVKEDGIPDVYVVSAGVAWPIMFWDVFLIAAYDVSQVIEIPAGTLHERVSGVGSCETGEHCLDLEFLGVCGAGGTDALAPETQSGVDAGVTADGGAGSMYDAQLDQPRSDPEIPVEPPTDAGIDSLVSDRADATNDVFSEDVLVSSGIDLSWVYRSESHNICLNARYFVGGTKAVFLIWTGPNADARNGPVSSRREERFCWDFSGKPSGVYRFWADVPDGVCAENVCPRDAVDGNGAQYGDAPLIQRPERDWLRAILAGVPRVEPVGAMVWRIGTVRPGILPASKSGDE